MLHTLIFIYDDDDDTYMMFYLFIYERVFYTIYIIRQNISCRLLFLCDFYRIDRKKLS